MSEADSRIIIDKLLRESEWILPGDQGNINVKTEKTNKSEGKFGLVKTINDE